MPRPHSKNPGDGEHVLNSVSRIPAKIQSRDDFAPDGVRRFRRANMDAITPNEAVEM
ncbi:MAG: hypothetical protein J07HQX50_00294 [Haloquadratum sp. J07HQX50]|nr:MAG: hypothetical protein J07HQX50_00294 [Haloquadratum sp. J07HQX50]